MKKWNWQRPDWPHFSWDMSALLHAETLFSESVGMVVGGFESLEPTEQDDMVVELMTSEAYDTSQIEGEYLDRQSIQSSIRHHLGFSRDRRRVPPAEAGVAQMMVNMFRTYDAPLTHEMLFAWHGHIVSDRMDLEEIGRYRSGEEPMRIVSRDGRKTRVHFEAPPADRVQEEMERFLAWFNQTRRPAIATAGIAHLWFESIHPFEDGNGRIGRALAEKALMRGVTKPCITSLASTISRRKDEYYRELDTASRSQSHDATRWLSWFAAAAIEGNRYTEQCVKLQMYKARLLDRLGEKINERQRKVLLRMFAAGLPGFAGGLSAKNYRSITDAPAHTATRDLADLTEKSALIKTGELKATRYQLNIPDLSCPRVDVAEVFGESEKQRQAVQFQERKDR